MRRDYEVWKCQGVDEDFDEVGEAVGVREAVDHFIVFVGIEPGYFLSNLMVRFRIGSYCD